MYQKLRLHYRALHNHYADLPKDRKRLFYWSVVPTGYFLIIGSVLYYSQFPPLNLLKFIDSEIENTFIIIVLIFINFYPIALVNAARYSFLHCRQGWNTSLIPLAIHAIYAAFLFMTNGYVLFYIVYLIFLNAPAEDL